MIPIHIHIGLAGCGDAALQAALDAKRASLLRNGFLFPRSPGGKNHTRLFMAVTDPDRPEPLRWQRGFADPRQQSRLRIEVIERLSREIDKEKPDRLLLSAVQLGDLRTKEVQTLHATLSQLSSDITISAIVDEPSRFLASRFAAQILDGRTEPLEADLVLAQSKGTWEDLLAQGSKDDCDPFCGRFASISKPPLSLDLKALVERWECIFGQDTVTLLPFDRQAWKTANGRKAISKTLGLVRPIGSLPKIAARSDPSVQTLERTRQLNDYLARSMARGFVVPMQLRRAILGEIETAGPQVDPGSLFHVHDRFSKDLTALKKRFPDLAGLLAPPVKKAAYVSPELTDGFRASQYMAAFMPRIRRITSLARRDLANGEVNRRTELTEDAKAVLSESAVSQFERLKRSRFAPHDRLGFVDSPRPKTPFSPVHRKPQKASTGRIIVGCMKNEAPYIVEWIAYHRAIGFDGFIIYSNDSEDGTTEILAHLSELGVIEHRVNDNWRGKSPQQHALNLSLKEPLVANADWIAHIDVDEFINIHVGNGTLDDLFAATRGATNIAMTWRLFGHNGIEDFEDRPVIEQFTAAAPRFCPKPHTAWGFKTLMRNIGAYQKLSCHRPNKLLDGKREDVNWVNGSGIIMEDPIKDRGWRSEMKSIGYDLVQLNHYALRSAESFLVKRQRGRALHVDRSIGLNYWVRMDWSDCIDLSIQRNVARMRDEMRRLLSDTTLRDLHGLGVSWHQEKAKQLRAEPGFAALYDSAIRLKLTALERAAYSLALDQDS